MSPDDPGYTSFAFFKLPFHSKRLHRKFFQYTLLPLIAHSTSRESMWEEKREMHRHFSVFFSTSLLMSHLFQDYNFPQFVESHSKTVQSLPTPTAHIPF